ncbi:class I adenylate-forming enzyme family protein [Caballeronia humi]|uniref:Long-chain fatty acid--CoA ligase n=1 Tax=Caballeronia humi TaxID=326474 RepID=A0A158FZJ8_9BURK|nr:AMP-binding protein [Caballeronia humi]SAL25222.1 long-chain fatty acid--CoA ligase [Caballeronia humi]
MEDNGQVAYRPYVDALLERLKTRADQMVVRYQERDVTGDALRRAIFRYARALKAVGIGRGSLVAQFASNCPDALAIRYAANLLGAGTMFLPALADANRRTVLLERIRPTLLVVFAETAQLVPVSVKTRVVGVGAGPASARLDKLAEAQSELPMKSRAKAYDLAVIVSSGGTTGVPKGSYRSFAAYSAMVGVAVDEDRRQLVNGPLAYLSQVLVDKTLVGGGTIVLERRYEPAQTLATIEAERITDVFLVEPQLFEVMDHPDVLRRDLSSLRSIAHVGGSAPAILRRRAIARLGTALTHMYGASEAGLVSVLPEAAYDASADVLGSSGCVLPGVDVRFRLADGTLARMGQHGKIEVRSRAVAQGYYHQEVESAQKFQDGWCLTGDIGFLDKASRLHVLGRATDVAEVDGRAIGPTLIEEVLCQLSGVRYAVAFAANSDANEHGWIIAIEPWNGRRVDVARCMRALEAAVGVLIADAVRICIVDRLPLTEQGKVDRAAIGSIESGDANSDFESQRGRAMCADPSLGASSTRGFEHQA